MFTNYCTLKSLFLCLTNGNVFFPVRIPTEIHVHKCFVARRTTSCFLILWFSLYDLVIAMSLKTPKQVMFFFTELRLLLLHLFLKRNFHFSKKSSSGASSARKDQGAEHQVQGKIKSESKRHAWYHPHPTPPTHPMKTTMKNKGKENDKCKMKHVTQMMTCISLNLDFWDLKTLM